MTQRCLRITAAALTLAAVLALAAPAHAAGRTARTPGIRWIEDVVQWVARMWVGTSQERGAAKYGGAIDPNGNPVPPPPSGFGAGSAPNEASSEAGGGTDPNG